ncbi:MAG: reverse transcriptase family protein [Candidatus Thiodiazotropha endolucinida]|nr:reverse transcriptase family protein [Candidatus Thiodiazotropha taylori]MCW4263158.1 reverse transcriptase family protein [Candidatus Thiodiazotropha endolucinida]
MERVVFKHLYNYLKDNTLLYKYQSGFIPGHSTTFQLVDIYHHICQTFDNKQISCMVFCDISKVFDRVWHKGLLFKLEQNGIEGALLDWLSSYLSNRKQCVALNSSFSENKDVLAGVPQGSVLGPLLFLIYVNDIAEHLLSLTRLYADDSSLFVSASNIRDTQGILNHDLAIISLWAKQWLINFNPNKTTALLFSLRELGDVPDLIFDGVPIQFVTSHRHLGITFNEKGKWYDHIEQGLSSASKVIGVMRKLKYTFSYHALNQIYISYVRPILEYSSIVWDNCTVEQARSLEKLQNEAARIVTGLTRSVSLERLYKECNWESLAHRRNNQKIKFMYKATHDMVPSYIADLIPHLVGEATRYDLRNRSDINLPPQRTTIFQNSCIPSSIRAWNSLDDQYRDCQTLGSFCYRIKKELNSTVIIPNYYFKGNRKLCVLHCRLRNRCSDLHADLFYNHLRDNALCECQQEIEDAEHFIFRCNRYVQARVNMFHKTRQFHPLSVSDALLGRINLPAHENELLFQAIQIYIRDTGRFNNN